MAGLMANKLFMVIASVVFSAAVSGFYFHGVGVDRTTLSYENAIQKVKDDNQKKYIADVEKINKQADARLSKEKARQDKLKPREREVIRYVTQDKVTDSSQCAITDNGLHILSRYLSAASDSEG